MEYFQVPTVFKSYLAFMLWRALLTNAHGLIIDTR